MAASWMKAKMLKRSKQRRAWAKAYSMKRAGPNVHAFGVVQLTENKDGVTVREFVSIANGQRSKLAGPQVADSFAQIRTKNTPSERQPWLEAIFKDHNPLYDVDGHGNYVANEAGIYRRQGDVPRAEVLAKLMQTDRLQKEQRFLKIVLTEGPAYSLLMFWSGDEAFLAEKLVRHGSTVYKCSITYVGTLGKSGREWALKAAKEQCIGWDSKVVIEHPPSSE